MRRHATRIEICVFEELEDCREETCHEDCDLEDFREVTCHEDCDLEDFREVTCHEEKKTM